MSPLLEVRDLKVAYGKIMAVKGISFTVDEGDVVSLTVSYTHLTLPTKRIV